MSLEVLGLSKILNFAQSTFIALLRIWSIPLVVLLSIASGYTTYFGLKLFITWWIALFITIAVQSIIVVCSLEIAGLHWKANKTRYMNVFSSLIVAIFVSISFSYFKFYEISQTEKAQLNQLSTLRKELNVYLVEINNIKSSIIARLRNDIKNAEGNVLKAKFGKLPEMPKEYRTVGDGPYTREYKRIVNDKKKDLIEIQNGFKVLDNKIGLFRESLSHFEMTYLNEHNSYSEMVDCFQAVIGSVNALTTNLGFVPPNTPIILPLSQIVQSIEPSFDMWYTHFALFPFACAVMVDFFTFLLSYRIESTAPGPLNPHEKNFIFNSLGQFTEWSINPNDQLELVIEKTEIERARKFQDWQRMFAVSFLLSRGYLRKVSNRLVEFSPNLYAIIAEKMATENVVKDSFKESEKQLGSKKIVK